MLSKFKKSIKRGVNSVLAKRNYRLAAIKSPLKPSGFDLEYDLRLLINQTQPICLDVGANIGQTIEELIDWLDQPIIHSFEPSSEIFKKLTSKKQNNQDNWKQVTLYNTALGSNNEKRELTNYDNNLLSSLLPLENNTDNPFLGDRQKIKSRETVTTQTVDSFLSEKKIEKINLLKIDTQGFDIHVLKGAEQSIKEGKIDFIFLEMNFVPMYEGQGGASELIAYLDRLGQKTIGFYDIYRPQKSNHIAWSSTLFGRNTIKSNH